MRSMRSEVNVKLTFGWLWIQCFIFISFPEELLLYFALIWLCWQEKGWAERGLVLSLVSVSVCLLCYGSWKVKIVIRNKFDILGTSKEKGCTLPQVTQTFSKSSLVAYRKSEKLPVGKHFHFKMCKVIINLAKRTDKAVLPLYIYIWILEQSHFGIF